MACVFRFLLLLGDFWPGEVASPGEPEELAIDSCDTERVIRRVCLGVEEADGGEVGPSSNVLSAREPETGGVEAPPEAETEGESVGRLGEPVTMAAESGGRLVEPVTDSLTVAPACSVLARPP